MAKEAKSCYQNAASFGRKCPSYISSCYKDEQLEWRFSERRPTFCSSSAKKYYDLGSKHNASELEKISKDIARKLMTNCIDVDEISPVVLQKLKNIEYRYRNITEGFSLQMNKWLKLRKKNIESLQKSRQKFNFIYRSTTALTFISSAVELASSLGFLLQKPFNIDVESKLPLILVTTLGGVTCSWLALAYSKKTLEDISKGINDEKGLQKELETIYRKGNWMDKGVQELFQFGVDVKLLKEAFQDIGDKSDGKQSWRHNLCAAIILTNMKKDISIIEDETFLASVKAFVESPVAYAWVTRMKLRKLLDEMSSKIESFSEKELISDCEPFKSQVALNMYPLFLPAIFKTGHSEKWRLIFSAMTTLISAIYLTDTKGEDFLEMGSISSTLLKEYKKIRKINRTLFNDYD